MCSGCNCPKVCGEPISDVKMDLAFVVDSSSSITHQDYDKLKRWIRTIVEALNISRTGAQVAILQFSGQRGRAGGNWVSRVADFKDSNDKDALLQKIDRMRKLNGDTCIGEGLNYFLTNMFTPGSVLYSPCKLNELTYSLLNG